MKCAEVQALAKAYGQDHVFAFWETLTESEQEKLAKQVSAVDFELIRRLYEEVAKRSGPPALDPRRLEPSPVIGLPQTQAEKDRCEQARKVGEEALRNGRIGCFLVAGGQGTRLGLSGPKGCFDVGPVRKRSLFQLHAEKIMALRKRYGAALPWVVMTSDATDSATRAFFEEMFFFGLGEDTVRFCKQESLPAIGLDGRLLMESRSSLCMSPNGHGGSIKAIHDSGCLDWLARHGVDTLSYFQVDNVLVRICDPVFIGHHLMAGAEMSSKVCRKRDWREKVGVIGFVDGKLSVIEYSDLPDDLAQETLPDGTLKWWAGSIAIHMLDVSFLRRLNQGGFKLPYHKAEKAIACIGPDGHPVKLKPGEKNGLKFETFIFDALPMAKASVTVETERALDFAPIKNATGEDSPASARAMLTALWASWLERAGKTVPRKADGTPDCRIDISPLTSIDGEHLGMLKIGEIKRGGDVVA